MKRQRGFTIIELMTVTAIIGILVSLALVQYKRARMYANETAACSDLKAIHAAQETFKVAFGGYATDIDSLNGAQTLDGSFGSGGAVKQKNGYSFVAAGNSPDLFGNNLGFEANATPISNSTGSKSFCISDSSGLKYVMTSGDTPAPIGSTAGLCAAVSNIAGQQGAVGQ